MWVWNIWRHPDSQSGGWHWLSLDTYTWTGRMVSARQGRAPTARGWLPGVSTQGGNADAPGTFTVLPQTLYSVTDFCHLCWLRPSQRSAQVQEERYLGRTVKVVLSAEHAGWGTVSQPSLENAICRATTDKRTLRTR